MKNPVRILLAAVAFASLALGARAQEGSKILVFDMAKVFEGHYKTQEQSAKLRADAQKAEGEFDRLNKEGNALVAEFKELDAQVNNPTATPEAKDKAKAAAQAKYEEIQKKQQEVQQFRADAQRALEQRSAAFRQVMVDEISKVATDIAKKKGAILLIDRSGVTGNGVSAVVFSDPSLDITDEVVAEINKSRPAAPAAPVAAPAETAPTAPAPAAAPAAEPTITVPGAGK